MDRQMKTGGDINVPASVRLAGLWASVMFCYVYSDLISFYIPGRMEDVAQGDLGPLGVASHPMLVGIAAVMAIPSLMVALCLWLPYKINRIANLVLGTVYTLMIAATMFTAPPHYVLLGSIEIALTGYIAFFAWRWAQPRLVTE